ncbi:MAG: HNH endonuclease domain-containing protein [Sarcina sp.]
MLDIIEVSKYKNIDIKTFQIVLDENLTTSYKILWFKGILEEIELGNRKILFEDIVVRMIVNAWFPIVRYKLSFGVADQLKNIISDVTERFNLHDDIKKEVLLSLLKKHKFEIEKEVSLLCKYVPFRLLSPFYKNQIEGTDYNKQKQIQVLNNKDMHALYKVDIENKNIKIIDDEWCSYLYSNQKILKEWANYKLVRYVQKRNLSVPAISLKLDFVMKRELANQTKVWKIFLAEEKCYDIYTGKEMKIEGMSLDHYIPWSFILHDELWNLIPTPKNVNSSKNDKLPNLEETLDLFCDVQFEFVKWLRKDRMKYKKVLESYLEININIFEDELKKVEFVENLKATISPLHQIANNQGFQIWKNNNINSLKAKEINEECILIS